MTGQQRSALLYLILSKTFERSAFYLLAAVIVQHVVKSFNFDLTKAGWYYSLMYLSLGFISYFSGLLGDKTNRIKTVKTGMIILTISYLILYIISDSEGLLLLFLIILGVGIGLIVPNIYVFTGHIFNEQNRELKALPGFIFLSLAINIGVFVSIPLSTYLKTKYGFNSVFIMSFILASVALAFFLLFEKKYKKLDLHYEKNIQADKNLQKKIFTPIIISILIIGIFISFILGQKSLTLLFYIRDSIPNGFEINSFISKIENSVSVVLMIIFAVSVIFIKKFNWKLIFGFIITGLILGSISYILIAVSETSPVLKTDEGFIYKIFLMLLIVYSGVN